MGMILKTLAYFVILLGASWFFKDRILVNGLTDYKGMIIPVAIVIGASILLAVIHTFIIYSITKMLNKPVDSSEWADKQVEYRTDIDHAEDPYHDYREEHKATEAKK